MMTKIISKLEATIALSNGKTFTGQFSPSGRCFFFNKNEFNSEHDFDNCLKVRGFNEDGDIIVSYIFSGDYTPRLFVLKEDEPLEIREFINVYLPKPELENEPVLLTVKVEYEEVEVDENNLLLRVKESAKDSTCQTYENGEENFKIPVKVGEKFKTSLIKGDNYVVEIVKVEGLNITLRIKDKEVTITPLEYFHESSSGGYNTRYDYESWERYYSIELDIDSIKLRKE